MHQIAKGLVCALLFVATPALAEEWNGVAQVREMTGYVDVGSIRSEGAMTTFDLFTGYMYGQGQAGEVYYVITALSADCSTGAFSVRSRRAFDIDRKAFAIKDSDTIEDPLAENEFAKGLREFICNPNRKSSRKTADPYRASDDYFGGF